MTHITLPAKNILIIRLSAFGDVVGCLPVMQAIRAQHPQAKITFMTLPLFAKLLDGCPFFDQAYVVERWPVYRLDKWLQFGVSLRQFDKIYDLQRNDRTRIFRYLAPRHLRKTWIGRKGRRDLPLSGDIPYADVPAMKDTDLSWMQADISRFDVKAPYALLVAGCAPQHPYKRWPAGKYAELACRLHAQGITPVLIGGAAEADVLSDIAAQAPVALNLCGQTSFFDIAALARGAVIGVGNDTGPMHLISAVGCPVVSLFSGRTRPEQSSPKGEVVRTLQGEPIDNIEVDAVMQVVGDLLEPC